MFPTKRQAADVWMIKRGMKEATSSGSLGEVLRPPGRTPAIKDIDRLIPPDWQCREVGYTLWP
jgi:hypothetical protein